MTPVVRGWRNYHRWNPRGERLAALWAHPLVRHLRALAWLDRSCVALDFGCGYFDVGLGIADRVGRVDGIDIEEQALATAQNRAAEYPNAMVFGSTDDLPRGRYDLVIAGSVFQYLGNDENVSRTLDLFGALLRPDGRGEVLLGDLIPQRYSPGRDACRSLWVAGRSGVLTSMMLFLGKVAIRGCGSDLHRIAPERMAELAERAGFACERLPINLSPSRQRYTCRLKHRRDRPATK
jgi:SAM-dependent methyltransferase